MDRAQGVTLPSWLVILAGLAILLGITATVGVVMSGSFSGTASAAAPLYDEKAMIELYETARPAVVEVTTIQPNMTRFRFSLPQRGQGSGFLVDTEGHILTNYHVVQDATRIRVTLWDGQELDAQVTGTSLADDLALLRVDPQAVNGITPLPLGDSDGAKPGQMAIALGSPFGLDNSISVGVVSGVNRSRPSLLGRPITGMIQTDALLQPGSSGGPLLNSSGEVIGVNSSIQSSSGSFGGIGFAVSINTAKDFLAQVEETPTVKRPWLGISGVALSANLADLLNLGISRGVYIVTVVSDSPAQAAGLRGGDTNVDTRPAPGGDIITAVDSQAVKSVADIASYLNTLRPGDTIDLALIRDGEALQVSLVLAEWPDTLE